jgi:hypothetical protein
LVARLIGIAGCSFGALRACRKEVATLDAIRGNLLQDDFVPWNEEHFSKSSPEQEIVIQEISPLDSDIAHF